MVNQTNLQTYISNNAATLAALTDAEAAAAINAAATISYAPLVITTALIYAMFGPSAGAVVMENFATLAAAGRPWSDFAPVLTNGAGIPVGTAVGVQMLEALTATTPAVLTAAQAQQLIGMTQTTTYPGGIGGAVVTSDVTTARAMLLLQATAQALQVQVQQGYSVALSLVAAYQTAGGTAPTATQLSAEFAAKVTG